MIKERRSALEEVQARRAAYHTELLDWFGNRAGAFALAVWLLLMAFLAAAWRPLVAWLASKRAAGLEPRSYARAVGVAAATVAVGAASALGAVGKLNSVLAPLVIAAMVMLLGLAAWHSTAMSRRLVPSMATGLMLLTGLFIGLVGLLQEEPDEPEIAPRTAALARLAEPDPTAHPTKRVVRLRERAARADGRWRRAEARAGIAEGMLRVSGDDIGLAERRVSQARPAVERLERQLERR